MKVPLTTQTKFVNAVISLKDYNDLQIQTVVIDLENWCKQECEVYAFIVHDKDMINESERKTTHLHLVALLKTNRKRLSTTLNDISEFIGVSTLAISIEKLNDVNGSIRYLIHKDDSLKYQYDISMIHTNLSDSELDIYLNSDSGQLSAEKLIDLCTNCHSRLEILRKIGLGYYHLYRNVINDLLIEIHG